MPECIQLKRLTIAKMTERLPDFEFLGEGKPGYWFRRAPRPILYSFIVIQASQKYSCCEVDVAATFEPLWDKQYGRHHLHGGTSLPCLREGSGAIPAELVPYNFEPTESGFQVCLERICRELHNYAVPYFDRAENLLATDALFLFGLRWVERNLDRIPRDFEAQWFIPYNVWKERRDRDRPPIAVLEELKSAIRLEASRLNATTQQRKETGILAVGLLRYASRRLLPRE